MRTTLKTFGIILVSSILTSIGVFAFTDTPVPGSLTALVGDSMLYEQCGRDMVLVAGPGHTFCLDRYEATPSSACPFQNPEHASETSLNELNDKCTPESKGGSLPWSNVSQVQARTLCAKAGKRLPTLQEWYVGALATPDDTSCNTASGEMGESGMHSRCHSATGAFDMIGNAWEWVDETIAFGTYQEKTLPQSGFIHEIDERGIPLVTHPSEKSEMLFLDRFWLDDTAVTGVMRGGYYKGRSDAGIHAFHAASAPSFTGDAIGFRCARTL